MASYDDNGCTGHKSCYVLEAGEYRIYAGNDVRSAKPVGSFSIKQTIVVKQLEEAAAPVKAYKRLKATETIDNIKMIEEEAPLRTINLEERIKANRPETVVYKGEGGISLKDVYDGKATMEAFLSQLTDEDLACIIRGDGIRSNASI